MFLIVRHSRQQSVINVKDPGISAILLQAAAGAEIHHALLDGTLQVDPVLGRLHVLADIVDAFLGHHLELPDVVELHVHPPALAVVFQADLDPPIPCSLAAQDVPICRAKGDENAQRKGQREEGLGRHVQFRT